jgi:hypothetical protein
MWRGVERSGSGRRRADRRWGTRDELVIWSESRMSGTSTPNKLLSILPLLQLYTRCMPRKSDVCECYLCSRHDERLLATAPVCCTQQADGIREDHRPRPGTLVSNRTFELDIYASCTYLFSDPSGITRLPRSILTCLQTNTAILSCKHLRSRESRALPVPPRYANNDGKNEQGEPSTVTNTRSNRFIHPTPSR